MKKHLHIILSIAFLTVANSSCSKHPITTLTGGGIGGRATIIVIPEAYNFYVDTCMVFIKYGTLDAPLLDAYDDSVSCVLVNDEPRAIFSRMKIGLYYFKVVGIHSGFGHPPNVRGGLSGLISKEDSIKFWVPTYSYTP